MCIRDRDSTLALYRMINKGNIPVALITTINKYKKKSCFHGVSVNLIYEISKSLDIPVVLIEVAGNDYTEKFTCLLYTSLTGCEIEEAVGKGAGITKEAFEKKKWVVSKAIKINSPNKNDIIDVLSNVGGFDIAGMTGVFLGAAYYKIPVVIDGFISACAALSLIHI